MLINGRTFVNQHMEMHDLIEENNRLLLVIEHFGMNISIGDETIDEMCTKSGINSEIFVGFCNLYNGFKPHMNLIPTQDSINQIIKFLENAHIYYREQMYPDIKTYIGKLKQMNTSSKYAVMVEDFFETYFSEVVKHLNYENKRTFPYMKLVAAGEKPEKPVRYRMRHSEIETKLSDLKNLLLKHIVLKDERGEKRKLLFAIFELEFDLNIHSVIEEDILMPLVEQIEK